MPSTSFISLPDDVRFGIYRHLLAPTGTVDIEISKQGYRTVQIHGYVSLLQTCSTIYDEASTVLYDENIMLLGDICCAIEPARDHEINYRPPSATKHAKIHQKQSWMKEGDSYLLRRTTNIFMMVDIVHHLSSDLLFALQSMRSLKILRLSIGYDHSLPPEQGSPLPLYVRDIVSAVPPTCVISIGLGSPAPPLIRRMIRDYIEYIGQGVPWIQVDMHQLVTFLEAANSKVESTTLSWPGNANLPHADPADLYTYEIRCLKAEQKIPPLSQSPVHAITSLKRRTRQRSAKFPRFFDFPKEIRLHIYELLLAPAGVIGQVTEPSPPLLDILYTNRQFYTEAKEVLFNANVFANTSDGIHSSSFDPSFHISSEWFAAQSRASRRIYWKEWQKEYLASLGLARRIRRLFIIFPSARQKECHCVVARSVSCQQCEGVPIEQYERIEKALKEDYMELRELRMCIVDFRDNSLIEVEEFPEAALWLQKRMEARGCCVRFGVGGFRLGEVVRSIGNRR